MKLLTAHKILIGSGAGFFLFFGVHRLYAYQANGDLTVLATAGGGLVAGVALAIYYRTIGAHH